MEGVALVLFLSLSIELLTIILRLVFHLRSKIIQRRAHMPRVHHAYVGLAILIPRYFYHPLINERWDTIILQIALALIISDLVHHLLVLRMLKHYKYDLGMAHHHIVHTYSWDIVGILMILWGLFALVTPFTPGSWLLITGLYLMVGAEKTAFILQKILGRKLYHFLHINKFIALTGKIIRH
jgi:hypothetical protein